jgi:cupin superfamily acireductone dioxygenase involved in methionine salvage
MSNVQYKKHRVFRETPSVIFYDISVDDSNASDLVVHEGPAVSPPNDVIGAKQFYVHYHQVDHNRVLSGERVFELVNPEWKFPYHIVHLNRQSGALVVPIGTYHRSTSGEKGSIVINQAIRDDEFNPDTEFVPISAGQDAELYRILAHEKPVIHNLGE